MMPLSIGDEVRAGTYRLHSRFRRAINFTDGERLVSVVAEDIGAGPLNIVLRRIPRRSSDTLKIGHDLLAETPRFRSTLEVGGPASSASVPRRFGLGASADKPKTGVGRARHLEPLAQVLVEESHPQSFAFLLDERRIRNFRSAFEKALVERIVGVVSAWPSISGVRRLAGCGFGLTPSGDDFIAGTLIALNVLGQPDRLITVLYDAALGDNELSNTFLRLARDGRMTEKQRNLVCALLHQGDTEVRAAARKVLETGETSGADWATGFVMTAKKGAMECGSDGAMEKRSGTRPHHSSTPLLQHSRVPGEAPS